MISLKRLQLLNRELPSFRRRKARTPFQVRHRSCTSKPCDVTHWMGAVTTSDPRKRISKLSGRIAWEETGAFSGEYLPDWRFIPIASVRQACEVANV